MTTDPTFPDAPAQRHSETSIAAATAIQPKAGTLRAMVLAFLKTKREAGATDEETQTELRMGASTQRPRRVELVEKSLVVDSGTTRKTKSGRNAVVWVAAEFAPANPQPRQEPPPSCPTNAAPYKPSPPEPTPETDEVYLRKGENSAEANFENMRARCCKIERHRNALQRELDEWRSGKRTPQNPTQPLDH